VAGLDGARMVAIDVAIAHRSPGDVAGWWLGWDLATAFATLGPTTHKHTPDVKTLSPPQAQPPMLSLTRRSRSPRLAGPISDTRQRLPQLRCGASHAYRPSRNPARDLSDRAWRTRSPSPTQARTPLGPFLYISSVRSLAKTHQRASKRAGASGARCSDHPTVSDHQPSRNVSGTAVRNRDVNRDHPRTIDHPAIDHRERLWDRGGQIATRLFAIFPPKKLEANPRAGHPAMLCRTSAS